MKQDRPEKPVVLVTGASSGIGEGVARRFAAGGYRIVAVARRRERLERLAADLAGVTEVEIVVADVRALDAAERSVGAAMDAFGRLDCLVNNAGSGKWAPVGETSDEVLDEVIDTSLKAPFRFSRAALRVMRPDSSIINVGSTFGILGGLNGGPYCAAKAGLIGLTQAIAVDYGPKGIRANLVAPGVIPTEMSQTNWGTEVFRRKNHEMTPLHRMGNVEDVANVIFFLASKEGSYIQAQTIALDGGWTKTKYISPDALNCERVGQSRAAGRGWTLMDFAWDDQQAAFRSTVRAFLHVNLPADWESLAHGPASEAQTKFSKEFCAKLAQAGLLVPHWPARWGGRDTDPWSSFILAEEMWAVGEPRGGQYMNVNWIGPTLMKFGSTEQQERYIPPMARGESLWCQGFSEPEAGSDLASLRTRAERHESSYRINGQKTWTSYAGAADTCFLLARTAPGKNGISIFLLPMDTPGITVRNIPSLIGDGDIYEVFLDDVDLPETAILGGEGEAWSIVRTALSLERVGIPRFALACRMLDRVVAYLRKADRFSSAACVGAARARAACEAARLYSYQIVDHRRQGTTTGPEASAARFATVTCERLVAEFVVEHRPDALAGGDAMLLAHHQRAIVAGIASGAAEIQLNLVATEMLGLPREPR